MTQAQEPRDADASPVRNLDAVAADLLERAATAPAGRAALTWSLARARP